MKNMILFQLNHQGNNKQCKKSQIKFNIGPFSMVTNL